MVSKNIKSAVNTTSVSLGQHMKSDNHPFLVATYTRALCSNVKEKWNVKQHAKAHTSGLQFISEIDIKVKSFDIILWVSLFDVMHQIFYPFWKSFGTSSYSSTNVINENKSPIGIKFSSQNLPLLYIETNIIQLYLPENNILYDSIAISSSLNQECPKNEKEAEVLLLQLDCVSLTSQVENPLPRIILNPGIYSEALNSKTIALPGAAVEDRQYQMDIFGLALGSLPGSNMSCQTSAKREQFLHHPLTMGENPALEWNIGVIPENRNFANESNVITPVISPLNIRIAVAPAIIYEDQNKSQSQEKIAVAGISVEVSVTSDIFLYLSIEKTCFIYSLLKSNLNFFYGALSHFNQKKSTNNSKITSEDEVSGSQTSDEFQIYIPSCFTHDSSNNIPPSTKSEKSLKYNFVPFDILITAGSVSIMLFYHDETLNSSGHEISAKELRTETVVSKVFSDKSSKVKSHLETDQVKHKIPFSVDKNSNKSATSSEYYHFTVLHPFACVSIVQPHTYILCHPSSQKFESSCFDLRLYGSPSGHTVKKLHKSCTPVNDDFIFPYLETKPGEPNEKTGIPPAFFTVTCTDFFNDPANIKISIERPVKFNFRNDLLGSILAFIKCCQEKFSSVNIPYKFSINCNEQSVYMDSNFQFPVKLKILKFFEKIVLYTTQLVFEFMPSLDAVSEKLIISAGRVVINTEVETHKDELKSTELNVKVSSIILQSHSVKETWNFLQPLSVSLTVKCHFNPWFQIEFCIVGESLLLNLSLHHILKLKEIIKAIEEELLTQINSIRMMVSVVDKTLSCSAQHSDGNETKKRKHWVDDLRKGAFQFIQVSEDKDFQPKAHEIVFNRASPNQPASMTWRYPEPRALTKIHVSPVPFQCEEGKLSEDTQVLTCYLQFWNSAHHEYMNLCDFMLSETEHCSLDLPDLNSDFLAVSDKWRVLLDCRSYIDDDGVLEKETPCLSPLALAACMAIDSCFDPCLIPVLQIRASFELAKLTLYNYFQKTGYSPTLFPFEFDDESPSNQEFAVLSFINPTLSYIKWSSKLKGELSSGVTCEILEYRNLTMLPVISPVDIHCNSSVNFDKEKVPLIDIECIIQPCFVRLTQSIVHTISYTVHSFYQEFLSSPFFCSEYILPNYYLICNRLHESIRFGQTNTEEYVILSPLKVHAYSWWCHKSKQMLRLSIGSLHWKWSSDFSIDVEGIQRVVLDNNLTVIIRIKQLSNHQKQVIVDGQLTFHSELNFPVQLRCKFHVPTSQKGLASSLQFIKSLSPCSSSPAFLLSPEQCKNMTLSVTGILDTQLWSEEFFLDEKMLIKIPFENKNVFQNAWCQVARQSIEENITVIVVFFSPLFVIRSNLPIPLNVEIISQEGNEYDVHLIGRGQEIQLLDGSETGHELQFKFKRHASSDTDISAPPLSVSASYLSKMPIKMFEGHENLYEICCQMQSFNNMMWPYSFYERSCHPTTILESLYPCSEEYSNLILATGCVNICSKLKVECSQRWEGLNTILIDVKPYVLLINRLNTDLYLFDKNGFQWLLSQNSVAMPSFSEESFQLSIMEHGKYFYSCNLTLEESVSQKNASTNLLPTSFGNKEFQSIPCNGSLNILIPVCLEERKVFMFTLKSEVCEGMIVITAFPLISIMNKTQDELFLSLHCIQNSAGKVNFHQTCRNPIVLGSLTECCYPLVWWEDITSSSSPFPELVEINFYISLAKSLDLEWSYPVCFDSKLKDHSRHAVAVPVKYGANSCMSVPYVLTSHLHNGLLFLVVNQDPNPLLLLHNRTNMDIFYGESCSEVEGITIYEELQKHKIIPVLHPEGSCHYAFPSLEAKFPQVLQKLPMLCLGSRKKSSEKCTWSMPFKINIDKQFVHILGICDIMVHSEQLGHTLNLYIESVNRIELTAKEVRSRIALATDFNNHASSFVKETECAKSKTSSNKKDCEIKARSKLQSAGKKSVMCESTEHFSKFPYIFYINLRVIHTSFIICDEFKEINKSMEVLRLNIDNAVFYSRPHNGDSLCRLQEISLCFEHIQLDNQIDQESNIVYDFPVVLQRHSESDVKSGRIHHDDIFLPNKKILFAIKLLLCQRLTSLSVFININYRKYGDIFQRIFFLCRHYLFNQFIFNI
ncbi:vacuolar protein sorting-associated protein 13B-like isoform X2 [Stegodyphus dumicola]|uniref:vacuolar protein sorting-associated protein 13B-like isoform X2 n=1 Tax=Stegodyphus dumicola TaxID=202533 RepID=UPI0015B23D14|nr:vacuolar protein sorting-associated protein 13B-like isoform X2 [Stegodyphus dumicola]